jgi:hypothetical protein
MVGWYEFYTLHEKRPQSVLLLRKQAASVILSITSRQVVLGRREHKCVYVSCHERALVSGHGYWEGAMVGALFLQTVTSRKVNSRQHLFINWERRNSAVFLDNADGSTLATPGQTRTVKTRRKP